MSLPADEGPAAREQEDIMTSCGQVLVQQRYDLLDPSVGGWWHGLVDRGDERDPHPASLVGREVTTAL